MYISLRVVSYLNKPLLALLYLSLKDFALVEISTGHHLKADRYNNSLKFLFSLILRILLAPGIYSRYPSSISNPLITFHFFHRLKFKFFSIDKVLSVKLDAHFQYYRDWKKKNVNGFAAIDCDKGSVNITFS